VGDKIKKNWQCCAFGVICGYKHANFWRNRDDYGLKRRVTVLKSFSGILLILVYSIRLCKPASAKLHMILKPAMI